MKRISCFSVLLVMCCQPVNAQKVANRVRAVDTAPEMPGDLLLPGGIGAGIIYHQRMNNAPMPMLRDPENPAGWQPGKITRVADKNACTGIAKKYGKRLINVIDVRGGWYDCVFDK